MGASNTNIKQRPDLPTDLDKGCIQLHHVIPPEAHKSSIYKFSFAHPTRFN